MKRKKNKAGCKAGWGETGDWGFEGEGTDGVLFSKNGTRTR